MSGSVAFGDFWSFMQVVEFWRLAMAFGSNRSCWLLCMNMCVS